MGISHSLIPCQSYKAHNAPQCDDRQSPTSKSDRPDTSRSHASRPARGFREWHRHGRIASPTPLAIDDISHPYPLIPRYRATSMYSATVESTTASPGSDVRPLSPVMTVRDGFGSLRKSRYRPTHTPEGLYENNNHDYDYYYARRQSYRASQYPHGLQDSHSTHDTHDIHDNHDTHDIHDSLDDHDLNDTSNTHECLTAQLHQSPPRCTQGGELKHLPRSIIRPHSFHSTVHRTPLHPLRLLSYDTTSPNGPMESGQHFISARASSSQPGRVDSDAQSHPPHTSHAALLPRPTSTSIDPATGRKLRKVLRVEGGWEMVREGDWDGFEAEQTCLNVRGVS